MAYAKKASLWRTKADKARTTKTVLGTLGLLVFFPSIFIWVKGMVDPVIGGIKGEQG